MSPRFESLLDLARLEWFGVEDGRLVVKDKSVGPAVDMHTHLALAYVLPNQVDLLRPTPVTEHYLPSCCPLEMDVYVNDNFPPGRVAEMTRDLSLKSLTGSGMRVTHTVPNLEAEMAGLRIKHSVVLPIDFPVLSHNARNALRAVDGRTTLLGFGSVHPYATNVEGRLLEQQRGGARGVKIHPAVQLVRPDAHRVVQLCKLCGDLKLPVLWHCGPVGIEPRLGRYLSQVRFYEKPIAANPHTTFVLGHSGARQMEEALRLQVTYPNVYLEVSSQGVGAIRTILQQGDPRRVLYGSDWPFYPQAIALAKVLMATEGNPAVRDQVLYGNAARLLGLDA